MPGERLLLLAQSPGDLPPLSALLQDATVRAADIAFDRRRRRLVLLLNRYRHESGGGSRVRAALRLETVLAVQRRRWPAEPGAVLVLLALRVEDDRIDLRFGGDIALKARVEVTDIVLEDLAAPWPTERRPRHD